MPDITVQGTSVVESTSTDICILLEQEKELVAQIQTRTDQYNSIKTKIDSYQSLGGVLPDGYVRATLS